MDSNLLYFAFGSNMNPTRMEDRCPGAVALGGGLLRNYCLTERRYADIDFQEGEEVHGVLYAVTADHLRSLDRYEGVPKYYRRMLVDVEFNGETRQAFTYEMTAKTKIERDGISYPDDYRKLCSDGARFHRIKDGFMEEDEQDMGTVEIIAYGTLMTDECNHCYCRHAVSIRPCTITGTLYDTGWGFPAFVPGDSGSVKAELIEIPVEDWPDMDRLEGYPRLYDRKLIHAELEDGGTVEAWVYVMNELPPHAEIIASGDWKNRE